MNNLNNPNLKETIISTLQELKAQNPNFFIELGCLLTWKSKTIEGALITKVNGQRYLGLLRKDIKGQDYWKYKPLTGNSEPENSESSVANSNLFAVEIFQQRQQKTQQINHGKSNNSEQSTVNEQSQSND